MAVDAQPNSSNVANIVRGITVLIRTLDFLFRFWQHGVPVRIRSWNVHGTKLIHSGQRRSSNPEHLALLVGDYQVLIILPRNRFVLEHLFGVEAKT